MIVRSKQALKHHYHQLGAGDVVIGQIVARRLKKDILIDLLERGVACFPSPLSQLLNRSKTAQARLLEPFMPPDTQVITKKSELLAAIVTFRSKRISKAVTKENHKHCGHGIRLWNDLECLYNFMGFSDAVYPFVLQPFFKGFTDVRVIMAGEYCEAYARENLFGFRGNLSSGGTSRPFSLKPDQVKFCKKVMSRGKFPYAHLDVWVFETDNRCYLSEISLGGGLKGAGINQKTLNKIKNEILEKLASEYLERFQTTHAV